MGLSLEDWTQSTQEATVDGERAHGLRNRIVYR